MQKRKPSFKHFITAVPDFSKDFSRCFFRFWSLAGIVFLILGCWAHVIELNSNTAKEQYNYGRA